jgi:hypothetical protein
MDGRGVIFVGGCMRTGTTLLQRVLSASPDGHRLVEECQFLTALLAFFSNWQDRFAWLEDFYGTPERFDAFAKSTVDHFLRATFETLTPARYIILKHPDLTKRFPILAAWYPFARFFVVVRDPRDTIASILDVAERHRQGAIDSHLVRLGRDMSALSDYFKSFYGEALQSPRSKDKVAVIRYEDMVSRPGDVFPALSKLLGTSLQRASVPPDGWDRRNRDDRYLAAFWTELRAEPPSPASIGRHRKTLTAAEVKEVERCCADFNRVFSYW